MGLFAWLKRSPSALGDGARKWREEWTKVVSGLDPDGAARLRSALQAQPPLAPDLEVEEEMLDGLERLIALIGELNRARLPTVETTHRVVGADICHFSAPASMPDDPAQPSGRLLLTARRAIFIGGPKLTTLPWHAAAQVVQGERDLLLVRTDGQNGSRFRCNTFGDALCAAAIARHLVDAARDRRTPRGRDL